MEASKSRPPHRKWENLGLEKEGWQNLGLGGKNQVKKLVAFDVGPKIANK